VASTNGEHMLRLPVGLCLALFLFCSFSSYACALTPAEQDAFVGAINILIEHNPKYRYGAPITDNPSDPRDCSGALFWAARRAGFPVTRTTAQCMMWSCNEGWSGSPVPFVEANRGDLVGFLMSRGAIDIDHIGAVVVSIDEGVATFAHASSSHGFTTGRIGSPDGRDYWMRHLSHIKRLSFGADPNEKAKKTTQRQGR
jgi:hypothetical protein